MTLQDELIQTLETENDALRSRVRDLEALCGITFDAPPHLGLTGTEARMFGMLLKLPLVRKEAVMAALYGLRSDGECAEPKIVDVYACKLRVKLKPYGIAISTQWGQGYYLAPDDKARAQQQFELRGAVA